MIRKIEIFIGYRDRSGQLLPSEKINRVIHTAFLRGFVGRVFKGATFLPVRGVYENGFGRLIDEESIYILIYAAKMTRWLEQRLRAELADVAMQLNQECILTVFTTETGAITIEHVGRASVDNLFTFVSEKNISNGFAPSVLSS